MEIGTHALCECWLLVDIEDNLILRLDQKIPSVLMINS